MDNKHKKTRRSLSIKEKKDMIELKQQGYSNKYIYEKFSRGKSVVSSLPCNAR